jgi:hypothetical protein
LTFTVLQWQRPSEPTTDPADAVEIAITEEGIRMRNRTGEILIDRWAWGDLLAAADAGEYDATLPSAKEALSRLDA